MTRRKDTSEPRLLEHQKEVDQLTAQCVGEGRFAFDTEFVMEDRFESLRHLSVRIRLIRLLKHYSQKSVMQD